MSAGVIKEDARYGLSRLGDLDRFERVAVLTDSDALGMLVRGGAALVPGMETRLFAAGERAAALAWLEEPAEGPGPEG